MKNNIAIVKLLVFFAFAGSTAGLIALVLRWESNKGVEGVLALLAGLTAMGAVSAGLSIFQHSQEELSFASEFLIAGITAAEDQIETKHRSLKRGPKRRLATHPGDLSYEDLLERDPHLALAKLQIDMECHLRELSRQVGNATPQEMLSVNGIAKELTRKGILPQVLEVPIQQVSYACSQAIHGVFVTRRTAREIITVGTRILRVLTEIRESLNGQKVISDMSY
jgi:hypothetical protein